jgi:hypothetical protein
MVTASGKKLTLLKLSESLYRKLTLTVKSDDEIEEIVQKQLNVQKESDNEEKEVEAEA